MERLLLRPAEAAEALGIGRTKLYALVRANAIPYRRVGKSIRIPAAALKEWAETVERSTKPVTAETAQNIAIRNALEGIYKVYGSDLAAFFRDHAQTQTLRTRGGK